MPVEYCYTERMTRQIPDSFMNRRNKPGVEYSTFTAPEKTAVKTIQRTYFLKDSILSRFLVNQVQKIIFGRRGKWG